MSLTCQVRLRWAQMRASSRRSLRGGASEGALVGDKHVITKSPRVAGVSRHLEQPILVLECASGAVPQYRLPSAVYAARLCLLSLAYE